jgi:DNA-3-methyladenine glycosylase
MFDEPGSLYVYLSYGVHHCINVVAHDDGVAGAILIRGGIDLSQPSEDLPRCVVGPGRVGRFLGVTREESGLRLTPYRSDETSATYSRSVDDELAIQLRTTPLGAIECGPRVGVSRAVERPWRFWLGGSPAVSPYRPYRRRIDVQRELL